MFLEFDSVGCPNFDFWFSPYRDPGVPLELSGCVGSKSCINPKVTSVWFYRGPFYKKYWNSKILVGPRPAPPSFPVFSGCGPKIEIPLTRFCLPRCTDSKKMQHDSLSYPKTPYLGSGRYPEGPGVRVTRPKITCEEFGRPWKFGCHPTKMSKVIWLCSRDVQTQKNNHSVP